MADETIGFARRCDALHTWYRDEHGVRRWLDTDVPLPDEILKGNADLVPAEHAWMEART